MRKARQGCGYSWRLAPVWSQWRAQEHELYYSLVPPWGLGLEPRPMRHNLQVKQAPFGPIQYSGEWWHLPRKHHSEFQGFTPSLSGTWLWNKSLEFSLPWSSAILKIRACARPSLLSAFQLQIWESVYFRWWLINFNLLFTLFNTLVALGNRPQIHSSYSYNFSLRKCWWIVPATVLIPYISSSFLQVKVLAMAML